MTSPVKMPPKPGHTITFEMPYSMTTVKVNRLIGGMINGTLSKHYAKLRAEANYRRDPAKGKRPACYVHGFGTDTRDTLVARYTPTTGELIVHYPPNYWGAMHPSTDMWLAARVAVWDALLFAVGGPDGVGGVTKSTT